MTSKKMLSVRFDVELRAEGEAAAKAAGMTFSAWLEEAARLRLRPVYTALAPASRILNPGSRDDEIVVDDLLEDDDVERSIQHDAEQPAHVHTDEVYPPPLRMMYQEFVESACHCTALPQCHEHKDEVERVPIADRGFSQ